MLLRRAGNAAPPLCAALASLLFRHPTPPNAHARSFSTTTTSQPDSQAPQPPPAPAPPAPTHAIVRAVSRAFANAISSSGEPIDAAVAGRQHAAYVAALRAAGPRPLQLVELDAPDDLPDACFVEDTAVVVPGSWLPPLPSGADDSGPQQQQQQQQPRRRGVAVIARPPAPSRAREPEAVAQALRGLAAAGGVVEVVGEISAPGALDGGDVLILPPAAAAPTQQDQQPGAATAPPPAPLTVLVGLSEGRTNAAGAAQLRDLLAPHGVRVVPVPFAAALARLPRDKRGAFHPLHLKSAVTALSADVLVCADGPAGRAVAAAVHGALLRAAALPPTPPSSLPAAASPPPSLPLPTFAFLPEEDACAANVLLVGDAVVAQPSCEASERVLRYLCEEGRLGGRRLVLVDPPLEEMKKADGALTCCSILF